MQEKVCQVNDSNKKQTLKLDDHWNTHLESWVRDVFVEILTG